VIGSDHGDEHLSVTKLITDNDYRGKQFYRQTALRLTLETVFASQWQK